MDQAIYISNILLWVKTPHQIAKMVFLSVRQQSGIFMFRLETSIPSLIGWLVGWLVFKKKFNKSDFKNKLQLKTQKLKN